MKNWTTESVVVVFLILLFVSSVVRIPAGLDTADEAIELSSVIQQVRKLSNQASSSDSDIVQFQKALQSAVQALQVTAGLTTAITMNTSDKGDADEAAVVVYIRIPYLISSGVNCPAETSCFSLNNLEELMVDTSVFQSPDTPPPILG